MNSKAFKICIGCLISLAGLCSHPEWSTSCGPEPDIEEGHISYFEPSVFLTDSLCRSYYLSLVWYFGAVSDCTHQRFVDSSADENIVDWYRHFHRKARTKDIAEVIYDLDAGVLRDMLHKLDSGGTIILPDSVRSNTFLRLLLRKRDKETLKYIVYAKESGSSSPGDADPWNPEPARSLPQLLSRRQAYFDNCLRQHAACPSEYLRARYGFQMVRTAQYDRDFDGAIRLYDTLITPNTSGSMIRYRALKHKAGALIATGRRAEGLYLLSLIYGSGYQLPDALHGFNSAFNPERDWDSVYALARTNRQRAILWMMYSLSEGKVWLKPLEQMHTLDPRSRQLEVMLMRELHHAENIAYASMELESVPVKPTGRTLSYYYQGSESEPVVRDWSEGNSEVHDTIRTPIRYLRDFRTFVGRALSQNNIRTPLLWHVTAGYLDLMTGNYQRSSRELSHALSQPDITPDAAHQIRLLRMLVRIKSRGVVSPELERELPNELRWLYRQQESKVKEMTAEYPDDTTDYDDWRKRRAHNKYNFTLEAIGQNYLRHNNVPMSVLCFNSAYDSDARDALLASYATDNDLQTLDAMIMRGGRTRFQRMLLADMEISHHNIIDLRGTRFFRQGKFNEAYRLLRQLPAKYGYLDSASRARIVEEFDGWNLMYRTGGYGLLPADTLKERISKTEFLRRLIALERQARRGKRYADTCYVRIATALTRNTAFAASESGEISSWSTVSAGEYPFNHPPVARRMLRNEQLYTRQRYTDTLAGEYFRKAALVSRNREFAAKCWFMVDSCRKSRAPYSHLNPDYEEPPKRPTEGFRMLQKRYADTKTFADALGNCGLYRKWKQRYP